MHDSSGRGTSNFFNPSHSYFKGWHALDGDILIRIPIQEVRVEVGIMLENSLPCIIHILSKNRLEKE